MKVLCYNNIEGKVTKSFPSDQCTYKVAILFDHDPFREVPPYAHTIYLLLAIHCSYDFDVQLDLFYLSLIAHQNMAKALWNNMVTPAAQKRDYFGFEFTELCVCLTNATLLYNN